eukprot:COSAG05_NODE_86_length_20511_cov_71.945277_1_plen_59_part_10
MRACMKLDSEWQHLKYCYQKKKKKSNMLQKCYRMTGARATLARPHHFSRLKFAQEHDAR